MWFFDNISGAAIYAAEAAGDYLTSLCYQADRKRKYVTVQLSNRLVYMGYVKTSPNLKLESQLALIVAAIGMLDEDLRSLTWTDYTISSHWKKDDQGDYMESDLNRYVIILPTRIIENIHIFNPRLDRDSSVQLPEDFLVSPQDPTIQPAPSAP